MIPAPPSRRRLKIQDFAKLYPSDVQKDDIIELKNDWMNTVKQRDDKSQSKSLSENEYSQQDANEFILYYIQDLPLPKINVKVQFTHTYSEKFSSDYTSDELYTAEDGDEKKEDLIKNVKLLTISNDLKHDHSIQELITEKCFEVSTMDFQQTFIKKRSYDMTHETKPTFKTFERGTILSMNDGKQTKQVIFLQDFNENKYVVKSDDKVMDILKTKLSYEDSGKRKIEVFIRGDKLVLKDGTTVSFLQVAKDDQYISVLKPSEDRKKVIEMVIEKSNVKNVYTFSNGTTVKVKGHENKLFEVIKRIDNDFILKDKNHITKIRTSKRKIESDGKYLFISIRYEFDSNKKLSNVFSSIQVPKIGTDEKEFIEYFPIGMIIHKGKFVNDGSGHYVAVVKRGESWYYCSDTIIYNIDTTFNLNGTVLCLMYCTEFNPHSGKSGKPPPPLNNEGNRCYMNSAIHFLMCMQDNFES